MGFRWDKVALSQARGLDPISAYYKEKKRADEERRERDEKMRESRMNRMKSKKKEQERD